MTTSNAITIIDMKISTSYFPPESINDDGKNDNDSEGYSSSTIVIIVKFLNQYNYNLYNYTNLYPPTFFWNNSHTLFSQSSVSITLES